jgi:hypothetical protein
MNTLFIGSDVHKDTPRSEVMKLTLASARANLIVHSRRTSTATLFALSRHGSLPRRDVAIF